MGSWASQKTKEWQEARARESAGVPAVPVEQVDVSGRKIVQGQEVVTGEQVVERMRKEQGGSAVAAARNAMGTGSCHAVARREEGRKQ